MSASANAPETNLILEKLAGSMLEFNSASRHSSELAAKASIATAVSSAIRALGELLFIAVGTLAIALARYGGAAGLDGRHDAS